MKKVLLYFLILTSLISAEILSIDAGLFQLSIYRIILLIVITMAILNILHKGRLNFSIISDNYSIKFIFIWILYSIFSLIWIKDVNGWIRGFYFLSSGFVSTLFLVSNINNMKIMTKALIIFSFMILIHNFIGWYEVITSNYIFLNNSDRVYSYSLNNYPVSMFNNTNNFASFLLVSVFVLLSIKDRLFYYSMKILIIILIVSSCILIFYTGSRGNIIGLFVGFLIYTLLLVMKNRNLFITLIIALPILLILFLFGFFNPLILYFENSLNINLNATSGSDFIRLNLIKNGIYFVIKTFGFGVGLGNIEFWIRNYAIFDVGGIENIHNWWFELITSFGILIFILYIVFYLRMIFDFFKEFKKSSSNERNMYAALISLLFAFIIGSISVSSVINSEWIWVLFGILITFQINFKNNT
jgi:teichuronic acid biosynthesis protein TuaE